MGASVSRSPSLAVATILVNYDGIIKQIPPPPPSQKIKQRKDANELDTRCLACVN